MKKFWRRLATLTLYPIVFALVCAFVILAMLVSYAVRLVLGCVFLLVLFVAIGVTLWIEDDSDLAKKLAAEIEAVIKR